MKKISRNTLWLLILVLILYSCQRDKTVSDNNEVSGSATAMLQPDGSVVTREPTEKELKSVNKFHQNMRQLDQKYPGPDIPRDAILYSVKSVDLGGNIHLQDGPTIRMEGLTCKPETARYIKGMFLDETDKAVFVMSANTQESSTPAYLWLADLSLMQDPELKGIVTGPSYTSLNDIALINGWCVPARTRSNKYYDRYVELEKFAP